MDHNPLKQRLIGAIVLVALAVIFIPMLLNGGHSEKGVGFGTNIPPKPSDQRQVRVLKLDNLPQPPAHEKPGRALIAKGLTAPPPGGTTKGDAEHTATASHSKPAAAAPSAASSSTASQPKASGSADKTAKDNGSTLVPKAWAVQVGSFSHEKNALAMRDRLRGEHFPAFVDAVNGSDGTIYRVRVGPEVRRADALALQKRLAKHVRGKTLVVAHP